MRELLTREGVAGILRVRPNTISAYVDTGQLAFVRYPRRLMFTIEQVQAFILARENERVASASAAAVDQ